MTTATDSFDDLCRQLSDRLSCVESALLCVRARAAYLLEFPATGRGKHPRLDPDPILVRPAASRAADLPFRAAAAQAAAVSPATIDALLSIGDAVQALPVATLDALRKSHLARWTRALRKLATAAFDGTRAALMERYFREEAAHLPSARANLKTALGLVRASKASGPIVATRRAKLLPNGCVTVRFGGYTVEVRLVEHGAGHAEVELVATKREEPQEPDEHPGARLVAAPPPPLEAASPEPRATGSVVTPIRRSGEAPSSAAPPPSHKPQRTESRMSEVGPFERRAQLEAALSSTIDAATWVGLSRKMLGLPGRPSLRVLPGGRSPTHGPAPPDDDGRSYF
jgi:hypothetical protein